MTTTCGAQFANVHFSSGRQVGSVRFHSCGIVFCVPWSEFLNSPLPAAACGLSVTFDTLHPGQITRNFTKKAMYGLCQV